MLYRALECCVMGRNDEPTVTAWINGLSREDARLRLCNALSATWGVEPGEIVWDNMDDEVELEGKSVQDAGAGPRRWLEIGGLGLPTGWVPLYDSLDNVLLFLPARDRRRFANAWLEARKHATGCVVMLEEEASRLRERGDHRGADNLGYYIAKMAGQAAILVGMGLNPGDQLVGATYLGAWIADQHRKLAKAAEQLHRAARMRENGSPGAKDYEHDARERIERVLKRHPSNGL